MQPVFKLSASAAASDKLDLVYIMFYNFSKLSCQVMSNYTPYMFSSKKTKMKKTTKNNDKNDKIFAIFGISWQT